jgi:transposase
MKRDGRSFDHRTLEVIRLMAVERVRAGELPSAVIGSYGFSRTTIYKWIKVASHPGVGLRALHAKPATGRPRSLTPRQERQVFRWVNGKDPRQYGLDFGLWTRSVVADLGAKSISGMSRDFALTPCTARHGAQRDGRLSSNARVNGNRSAPRRR